MPENQNVKNIKNNNNKSNKAALPTFNQVYLLTANTKEPPFAQ